VQNCTYITTGTYLWFEVAADTVRTNHNRLTNFPSVFSTSTLTGIQNKIMLQLQSNLQCDNWLSKCA